MGVPMHIILKERHVCSVLSNSKEQASVVNMELHDVHHAGMDDSTFNSSDVWTPVLRGQEPFSRCHFS